MIKTLTFISLLLVSLSLSAQVYQGTGGTLRDDGISTEFTIDIIGDTSIFLSPEHGLKEVCVNLTHTWVSDLDIRLISPSGDVIMLTATKGDDLDNYENTCFSMDAATHIINGVPPFAGSFIPFSPLGMVNNGQTALGTWRLHIFDQYAWADSGELLNWSITFGSEAPAPKADEGSYFPLIVIRTDGELTIPTDPKIPGSMVVIDNGSGSLNYLTDEPSLTSRIGIETRGSSSQGFPKKNFGFETQDDEGDGQDVELLGLPEEEDFVLYASYTDKTLLRDALTYEFGNRVQEYAPRTVPVELYLNGDYHGIYWLEEKIKRDKNRVDIAKLDPDDLDENTITGGYILKVDRDDGPGTYFVSDYKGTYENEELRIVFEDPEGPDLHPDQQTYIQGFMRNFENALFGPDFKDPAIGYQRYADINSAVDFFILNEIGHNVDSYRLSSFLYKDRNSEDSLLHFGPLWDFNLAFGNVNYCGAEQTAGWTFQTAGNCGNTPRWWARFMEDENFHCVLVNRYSELRQGNLSTDSLYAYIDRQAAALSFSQENNFSRWPVLGIYVWPNYFIGQTYQEEVDFFKEWLSARMLWLDLNIPGCIIDNTDEFKQLEVNLYPNPANDLIEISGTGIQTISGIRVTNLQGTGVLSFNKFPEFGKIDVSALPSGIYLIEMITKEGYRDVRKISVVR